MVLVLWDILGWIAPVMPVSILSQSEKGKALSWMLHPVTHWVIGPRAFQFHKMALSITQRPLFVFFWKDTHEEAELGPAA